MDLVERATKLAAELQTIAAELQTSAERRQQAELDRMLQNPADKATLTQLTDQAFRSSNAARVADQFTHILDVQGIPRFFSPLDRALLRGFRTFGGWLPGVAVPLVKEQMRHETANVVLPAERDVLVEHLTARRREGVRMNVNFLGEALLGEDEARARLNRYLAALALPEVEVLSVKISTIYSQISPLAWEHTLDVLCERLERLYREAGHLVFLRGDDVESPKMVYLDMEEYRDLQLTAEAFMRTLDRPGLERVAAGIALQAYIPDSYLVLQRLLEWARRRAEAGGSPITIRIVKGANMEFERVEASLRGWPQAPYSTKRETDANYKRMLHKALSPENIGAVRVGIASHNLFDLAYGLVLAESRQAMDRVQFEMLEGMANHQRRAMQSRANNLLLYAPACHKEEFVSAIGYLIRRLDENTGPDNFLRHAFRVRVGSDAWARLEQAFRDAFGDEPSELPRRRQNRLAEQRASDAALTRAVAAPFRNEPDTDFALVANVDWAKQLLADWEPRHSTQATEIPLVIGGVEHFEQRPIRETHDPSRPDFVVARYREATVDDAAQAVECARRDAAGWRDRSPAERSATLANVARDLRRARGDLIGAALACGGKTIGESDPEVSEAIDFVEYYARSAAEWYGRASAVPAGVVAVVPPWNFPIAIPCGGMAAALAAGNTVILKPASDTVLAAWELCQCFWRGGVPRETLQFFPAAGRGAARQLIQHPNVDAVILTGGTATALQMLQERPDLALYAETGGKNATIVTALADREQAIKHVVHSAFSHAGQKCSATSLLLLEAEVYDDPSFQRMLRDAVESLPVGSAWNRATRMGPLIRPPSGDLETALLTLEADESWLVLPERREGNPHLWSPGVKWGVRPESSTHLVEFFGPLLGVMRFERLDEAIQLVNQTGYGLTSGLQSLDDREQAQWLAGIRAGNLYINKPTVGAIVLRQPFGGFGKSSFGPAMKAGGPNYVAQFMRFGQQVAEARPAPARGVERSATQGSDTSGSSVIKPAAHDADSEDALVNADLASLDAALGRERRALASMVSDAQFDRTRAALRSFDAAWREEFSQVHDPVRLLGEDNLRRYLPCGEVHVRVHAEDDWFDVVGRAAAARATGARVIVSSPPDLAHPAVLALDRLTDDWAAGIEFHEETDADLVEQLETQCVERLRYAAPNRASAMVRHAAAQAAVPLVDRSVSEIGRLELLWYLREQNISFAYHRYGNLGARAGEPRADLENERFDDKSGGT